MLFFKTKVFKRIFLMYSVIIIITLLCLSVFVTNDIKKTIKKNQIYLNQKMIENVNDYFKQQNGNSKILIDSLYKKSAELTDTINYLTYDCENYINIRIDNYYNSNSFYYEGANNFIKSCFDSDSSVDSVIFYSHKKDDFTIYNSYGNIKYINDVSKKIKTDVDEDKLVNSLLEVLDKAEADKDEKHFYTINNIKNPYSLNNVGMLIIKYNLKRVGEIIKSYGNSKNHIIAINKEGQVVYDSTGKYTNKLYPYIDRLKTTDKPVMLDENSYINIANSTYGIMVVGVIPVKSILKGNEFAIYMSYAISLVLLIIAEMLTYFKIDKLSKRTEKITNAMKDVQNGNFKTRIETNGEDDEITLISKSFNYMCIMLEEYINKVYLAEIKQKNTEMLALQNQINPHFLYNTLESIRMKAVSNGDMEVSKMLYNLSVLFRNMVKGKTLINIGKEVEYCNLYLELFKFRYEGRFDYCIDVDEELLSNEIVKFTIQPIVENFIVHGARLDDDDNFILITIKRDKRDIAICIEDNGKGISPEKIKSLNERMENLDKCESLGLISVHERIRFIYGTGYGVTISNRKEGGTIVIIRIPVKEVDANV